MKKKLIWTVVLLLALIGVVLVVAQPQSPSLPAIYQGMPLSSPAPIASAQLPTI